jgi:hypothetical protein
VRERLARLRARVDGDEERRQHDVVVDEEHHRAGRDRDPGVARQCAVGLRFVDVDGGVAFGDRARRVGRAVVDDDRLDLGGAELRAQRGQRPVEERGPVARRDDHADLHRKASSRSAPAIRPAAPACAA